VGIQCTKKVLTILLQLPEINNHLIDLDKKVYNLLVLNQILHDMLTVGIRNR